MRYLFTIFHRLNSGGMRLTNQEIRNCIYTSPFNDLLKHFDNANPDWKSIKRRIWGSMDRFRSVEVLLRILAFGDSLGTYDGNLARFLNDYMADKAMLSIENLAGVDDKLTKVSSLAHIALSLESRKKLSLSLIEAVLVGIYVNILSLDGVTPNQLKTSFSKLKSLPAFSESARYAISSVENVKARLNDAIDSFSV